MNLFNSPIAEGRVEEDAVPGGQHHRLAHQGVHQSNHERRPVSAVEHLVEAFRGCQKQNMMVMYDMLYLAL